MTFIYFHFSGIIFICRQIAACNSPPSTNSRHIYMAWLSIAPFPIIIPKITWNSEDSASNWWRGMGRRCGIKTIYHLHKSTLRLYIYVLCLKETICCVRLRLYHLSSISQQRVKPLAFLSTFLSIQSENCSYKCNKRMVMSWSLLSFTAPFHSLNEMKTISELNWVPILGRKMKN